MRFVRTLPCASCLIEPPSGHRNEAAHIRTASIEHDKPYTGGGRKSDDKWTTPLCNRCHQQSGGQHDQNELAFWEALGINVFALALCIWSLSGDYEGAKQAIKDFRNGKRKK